jgi:hypothetical protein
MLALKRSLLNREQAIINVNVQSSCNSLMEVYTVIFYTIDEGAYLPFNVR